MKDYEVEYVNVSELIPYEKNPRKNEKSVDVVATSIKEYGFKQPIVVDKDNVVVVGHTRLLAAKKLNLELVPVIRAVDLSPAQIKGYRLMDNKSSELSEWDEDLLGQELSELKDMGFDIGLSGFSDVDLDVAEAEEDGFDAEGEVEKIIEPFSKRGDLFRLGDHLLLCGDSTERSDYEVLFGEDRARLVFTDPPYNVNYTCPGGLNYKNSDHNKKRFNGTGGSIVGDNVSDAEFTEFCFKVLKNVSDFSTDDMTIYWWFANKNQHLNRLAFDNAKFHMSQIIMWLKNSMVFSMGQDYHRMYEPCMLGWKKGKSHYSNKRIRTLKDVFSLEMTDFSEILDVWYQKRDLTSEYVHPTQKPIRLSERAIKKNSVPGDLVFDGFGGSGSTLMGCEQLGRRARVIEMDPKYVDVIIKRWCGYTGKKAFKVRSEGSVIESEEVVFK